MYERALSYALWAACMSGTPSTLELISQTIAAQHGTLYAERWLAAQQSKQKPSAFQYTAQTPSTANQNLLTESLNGPVSLLASLTSADIADSPIEARKTALRRLEDKAVARAQKLRDRVGFGNLELRSDRRRRLEYFHTRLVLYALAIALKRGYRKACSLTVHTVMELVGYCLNVRSSSTLYSYLHALKNLGLIDFKGHVTTVCLKDASGEAYEANRCDGALLCIRVDGYKKARLTRFDYQESPRNLQTDIEVGHTAYRLLAKLEESKDLKAKLLDIYPLIIWSLNPSSLFTSLESDSSGFASLIGGDYPIGILDLATSENRNQDISTTAYSIAKCLDDLGSLSFYQRLLWQLLRAKDRGWNFFSGVYHVIIKVLADKQERYARKPGALLVSRLKASRCWDELWRDQNQWVGAPVLV